MTEDEDEMNLIKEENSPAKPLKSDTTMAVDEDDDEDDIVKVEDTQYSEWFKVDEKDAATQSRFDNLNDDSDTQTEGASDEEDYSWIKPEDTEPQLSKSLVSCL